MTQALDLDHLRQWIGRATEATDIVTAQLVKGLRATLFQEIGEPKTGDAAPWTTHWCLAQPVFPMSQLGPDGHPARGGFLPPVPLPRRMWAGGEIEFFEALRVGDEVDANLADIRCDDEDRLDRRALLRLRRTHHHDIARHRDPRAAGHRLSRHRRCGAGRARQGAAAAAGRQASRKPHVRSVLLFRYSALTFNGHRIHYDRDYVTKVEGYPGLIFHGPLQAALIVEFAAKLHGDTAPKKFSYRGVQPLFEGGEFTINASDTHAGMELWIANSDGPADDEGYGDVVRV